jgi:hypothetical protein
MKAVLLLAACATAPPPPPPEPPPSWLLTSAVESTQICSWGIAGAAHDPKSEAPKDLAKERAIKNLAGMYLTRIIEAEIISADENQDYVEQHAVTVEVPEDVIEATASRAKTVFWYDRDGGGPLGREGRRFTYARSCIDDLPAAMSAKRMEALSVPPFAADPPPWLDWIDSKNDAALCAVGQSDPYYDSAEIFQGVVENVRSQLLGKAETWIIDSMADESVCRADGSACQDRAAQILAATSEAISKGVAVTHFWYDRKGAKRRRAAWGWGCVYRGDLVERGLDRMQEQLGLR